MKKLEQWQKVAVEMYRKDTAHYDQWPNKYVEGRFEALSELLLSHGIDPEDYLGPDEYDHTESEENER